MKRGKVWLVGAGCGAADLITVRGAEVLKRCEVLVYDDLIAPELLELAPSNAEKIYMGKRSGAHSAPQSEITACLIEKAAEGKRVVRLKGGDPFVFGRGGEEAEALLKAEIDCEEVPGITSAIAIPSEAGIPVTHRGVSRSVHIVTAHTADTADGLPEDLETLAALNGTLVFLMGLKQLPRIAQRLMIAGKAPDTPAAVLSGGNAPHPACVRGTLADIAQQAASVQPPAVIVVGEVAALELKSPDVRPLAGTTVALTGTDVMAEKLRPALMALGARVCSAGRMSVHELPVSLHFLCDGSRRWLVFTSANGVRVFFKKLAEQRIDLRRLTNVSYAVIGKGTAAALEAHGIFADLCPETATTEALGRKLVEEAVFGEVCLLRSAKGSAELYDTISRRMPTRDIALYDVSVDPESVRRAQECLPAADYLVFASAGGIELYFDAFDALPERAVPVCIGPVAARALERRGIPCLMAKEISAEGIVATILRHRGL